MSSYAFITSAIAPASEPARGNNSRKPPGFSEKQLLRSCWTARGCERSSHTASVITGQQENKAAKDKAGNAIEDLKEGDFTVLEDGKAQKISVFEFEKLTTDPAPPEKPTLDDVNAIPEAPIKTITTEAPGQVQYHDKRLLVLFFDLGSMGIPEQLRAQDSALKFLDEQITTADMVAIMDRKSV